MEAVHLITAPKDESSFPGASGISTLELCLHLFRDFAWLLILGLAGLGTGGCERQSPTLQELLRGGHLSVNGPRLVKSQGIALPAWFGWPADDEDYVVWTAVDPSGHGYLVLSVSVKSPFDGYVGDYGYNFAFDQSMRFLGQFAGGAGSRGGLGVFVPPLGDINGDGFLECATSYWDPEAAGPSYHGKRERLVVWQLRPDGLRILLDVRYVSAIGTTMLSVDVVNGTILIFTPPSEDSPIVAFTWDPEHSCYSGKAGGPEMPWQVVAHSNP
jgi:hypothetical protein